MTSRGGRVPEPAEELPPYLVWVPRLASGLDRDGYVRVDQVMTFPSDALGQRLGRLSPDAMTRVDTSLRFVLGL
jgi:mRNA-degrading endonuclease toxin of MazEF toxin-antitoxin module